MRIAVSPAHSARSVTMFGSTTRNGTALSRWKRRPVLTDWCSTGGNRSLIGSPHSTRTVASAVAGPVRASANTARTVSPATAVWPMATRGTVPIGI